MATQFMWPVDDQINRISVYQFLVYQYMNAEP